MAMKLKILSNLSKVFVDESPAEKLECNRLTALRGETVSFQVGYYSDQLLPRYGKLKIQSDIENSITVRSVELVPSMYPAHPSGGQNLHLRSLRLLME